MIRSGRADDAFWRTRGVARALGLNFTEEMAAGRLDGRDLAELVASCAACPHGAECLAWLGRHGATATTPPGFCRHRARLRTLAKRPSTPGSDCARRTQNPV